MEQLSASSTVLDCVVENYKSSGSDLGLVNSALGTLIEAGLALRSPESNSSGVSEVGVLEAVACGSVRLSCSRGALIWFQVGARGVGQGMYERRDFEGDQPAKLFVNPSFLDSEGWRRVGSLLSQALGDSVTATPSQPT